MIYAHISQVWELMRFHVSRRSQDVAPMMLPRMFLIERHSECVLTLPIVIVCGTQILSWPDSVRIADWFKSRDKSDQVDNEEKQRRINGEPGVSPTRNNRPRERTDVEPTSAAVTAAADAMDTATVADDCATADADVACARKLLSCCFRSMPCL